MTDLDRIVQKALEAGFSAAVKLDVGTIRLRPEVRDMCAADKCRVYAKNWTCPPACGSLEECAERISGYKNGIIVQTVGRLDDEFDFEGMKELSDKHNSLFAEFAAELSAEYPNLLSLGAGGCHRCETCTYPDEPCRHPGLAISSMEAYGMLVSEVCSANNIPYYYGPGKLVYVGCYLTD